MTSNELAKVEAAYRLLLTGRTEDAREKLAVVITDAGGSPMMMKRVSVIDGDQALREQAS